jgi:hypothetical protein
LVFKKDIIGQGTINLINNHAISFQEGNHWADRHQCDGFKKGIIGQGTINLIDNNAIGFQEGNYLGKEESAPGKHTGLLSASQTSRNRGRRQRKTARPLPQAMTPHPAPCLPY